jgi:predicted solute-binding protein
MKRLTENEKRLTYMLLASLKKCFNEDGTLMEEYYQNVILFNLEKEEKETFDTLLKKLIA